ncbi:DUF3560 domain-containing protein [Chitinophaga barathri]|nr:DUF3560 domain-containing protein [Chitinophaga barathri]
MKNDFEQRKQNRIDYAEGQAAKHQQQADDIDGVFGSNFSHQQTASYFTAKAEGIRNDRSVSSDDPDAIEKLIAQVAELEKIHEFMVAANKCVRKNDKEAFLHLEGATEENWHELMNPRFGNVKGYPRYRLTNNSQNIRTKKQRIAQLHSIAAMAYQMEEYGEVTLIVDPEKNRVQLKWPNKPSREVIELLGKRGFHFHRIEMAWQRKLNPAAEQCARQLAKSLL